MDATHTMNTQATDRDAAVPCFRLRLHFASHGMYEWAPAGRLAVAVAPYEHLEGEYAYHAITMRNVLEQSNQLEGGEMRPLSTFRLGDEVYVHDGEPTSLRVTLDGMLFWRAQIPMRTSEPPALNSSDLG